MTDPNAGASPDAGAPAAVPDGGTAPTTPPNATPDAGGENSSAAAGAGAKPEWAAEKFWDPETGLRGEQLHKSYTELEGERLLRTKNAPAEYALPEGLKPFEAQVPAAALKGMQELARAEGYSQQGFELLLQAFYGDPQAEATALKTAYGDKLDETIEAVRLFAGTFGEEHKPALDRLAATADGVKLLDAWRRKGLELGLPGAPGEGAAPAVTEEALRAKMASPAYWRDRDPKVMAEVEAGFRQLYPGEARTHAVNPGGA